MLLIYTSPVTSRFSYITEVLFTSVLLIDYRISEDKGELAAYNGTKINYSSTRLSYDEIWLQPHALLYEKGLRVQEAVCSHWRGLKIFFTTAGDIPFDFFAASFYLITRYEEYLPHERDMYGRYSHTNSIAFNHGFLHLPLVNLWMKELEKMTRNKFTIHHSPFNIHDPPPTIQHLPFSFTPTYDIDIAYSYKGKGLLRNAGGVIKEICDGKFDAVIERASVVLGRKKDPFDSFAWLDEMHGKYGLQPIYFFLLAGKNKLYDKNISPRSWPLRMLMKHIAEKYSTGIHPSWQSGDDEHLLAKEINALAGEIGRPVFISRQHYIRMNIPATYLLLIKNGITEEYSMGYGSINGFRASLASPFYWYDLENDVKTNLLVRPFCFMEANSFFEQHYTAEQAATELQQYHDVVKSVGGQLITIFHNHFLNTQPQWLAWRNMYAAFLQRNFG